MAGFFPERWRWKVFAVACLCGLVYVGMQYGRGSQPAASQDARGASERLAGLVERLDRPSPPKVQFLAAWNDLNVRVTTAEYLEELRRDHPGLKLPRLSCERLQMGYAQARELAEDAEAVRCLEKIEARYLNAVAFTAAEEAAVSHQANRRSLGPD